LIQFQSQRSNSVHCPYCRDLLEALPALACTDCGVGYHESCVEELLECATVGCAGSLGSKARVPACVHCQDPLGEAPTRECGRCSARFHGPCARERGNCDCGEALTQPVVFRGRANGGLDLAPYLPGLLGIILFLMVLVGPAVVMLSLPASQAHRYQFLLTVGPIGFLLGIAALWAWVKSRQDGSGD
jgi:phorbol esters/diacylglycerol binding protein